MYCLNVNKMSLNSKTLFPQILDSEHRHYHCVTLTYLSVVDDDNDDKLIITSHCSQWTIRRSDDDFRRFDSLIHSCLIERDFSLLSLLESKRSKYLTLFNRLLNEKKVINNLKCVLLLNWLECDYQGYHLIGPKDLEVNRRAIGAALVVRDWRDDSNDAFLRLENEEILSILEINGFWSKGKKGIQVGLFPSDCVRLIDDSVVKGLPKGLPSPLLVRRLRISSLFPHFFHPKISSPERPPNRLSIRPKVFARDLAEQLFESGEDVPPVVSACSKFIEEHGLVDGVYRLSGVASNISRLRDQFDSGLIPELNNDFLVSADIHCVSSLLKLFFRLLPNPLLTFESYEEFVSSVKDNDDTRRLPEIRRLIRRLPPPHFRTVRALIRHLRRVSLSARTTGMTEKNLSIVWAPNLLRSRDIGSGDLAALQVIGIQAILTEILIKKCSQIFDDNPTTDTQRIGCFGRQLSERVAKKSCKEALIRRKSFESFFSKKDFFSDFRINFAKIQTFVDLMRVSSEWQRKPFLSTTVWTTTAIRKCVPFVTTTTTDSHCIVVNDRRDCIRDDTIVVKQMSRERIERIKTQRRQQLRQQFLKDDTKPVPTPRTVRVTPTPTPRLRSRDEIRILTTSSRTKRNNWNENAIQMLNKR